MRTLVSVDMEGLNGITHGSQVLPQMKDYSLGREIATRSINATTKGIRAGGSEEIYVVDAHDGNRNIRASELDNRVNLISGYPKPLSMVEGVRSCDKAFFLGYHSKAGTLFGVLDHTYSTNVHRLKVNGEEMGEIGLSAGVAGFFGKPVVFFAGDKAAVSEANKVIEEAEFVVMKEGISRYSAVNMPMETSDDELTSAAKKATAVKGRIFSVESPVSISLEFQNSGMADSCMIFPGVERIDAYTVAAQAGDMLHAYQAFRVLVSLSNTDHGNY